MLIDKLRQSQSAQAFTHPRWHVGGAWSLAEGGAHMVNVRWLTLNFVFAVGARAPTVGYVASPLFDRCTVRTEKTRGKSIKKMDCSPKEEALHLLYCTACSCNLAYCLLLLCYLLPIGATAMTAKKFYSLLSDPLYKIFYGYKESIFVIFDQKFD